MVQRFCYGTPVETDAVPVKPAVSEGEDKVFALEGNTFSMPLAAEDIVYGLGQNVRGINKRGWIYESNCADNCSHVEDAHSLYGAHNFLLIAGQQCIGAFFDTPGKVTFDVGYTLTNRLTVTLEDLDCEVYVLEGESEEEVVKEFRALIGKSYIPPRWAFGYGQSRWSYMTSDEVRSVVEQHRKNHLPLDSVYLDIDYMERYKDFTIDKQSFGDFASLVKEMQKERIHLVPIIDAGVKIEEGYEVYEEGKEKGYFCKDENGEDFVVGVWPGKCHFPDMLQDEARAWFGEKYQILLEQGIDGFWNDMNEPAVFYSEKGLKKLFEQIDEYKTQNLDINSFFDFKGKVAGCSNNEEDYKSFYHEYKGKTYRHDKVHNLFGYHMTRAAGEAFERLVPQKRILLFSRASYIGMHRYGGIWQGDNHSWWSHLLLNIKMMPSLNMCGFLYTGADLGGFGADTTQELMLRWLGFGVFTPLMRNHSAAGTRRQEAYAFEDTEAFRHLLGVRYQLLPYIYSEFMKAALDGKMMFRPLGFVYREDKIAKTTEDQLLLGDSIMIAPVHEQNAIGRIVYFPEPMKQIRFAKGKVLEEKEYAKGHFFVEIPLDEVCIFLRKNYSIPLAEAKETVAETDFEKVKLYSFGEEVKPYEYYYDDGETKDFDMGKHIRRLS